MKKILILPDAGPDNPFQYQLIDLLENNGYVVKKAHFRRFFATSCALRRFRPDYIYYDWIQSFTIGRTWLLTLLKSLCFLLEIVCVSRILRIPVVHTLHNIRNHAGLWVKTERMVYYYFLRHCYRIRVYSETTRRKIILLYRLAPEKVLVIQDVPYHYYYPNTVSRPESRHLLQIPEDAFVFLFLGMIKPYKGLEVLITAFGAIPHPKQYLVIAGESDQPEYGRKIEQLVANHANIIFHNRFIEKDIIQYYYRAADVVVLPFRNVEHSGSVDLAMSFGNPIITLKTPFLENLLRHQVDLLFAGQSQLGTVMQACRNRKDLSAIGRLNFALADQVNYQDLRLLFP